MNHDAKTKLRRRDIIRGTGAITIANRVAPVTAMEAVTPIPQDVPARGDSALLGQRSRGWRTS